MGGIGCITVACCLCSSINGVIGTLGLDKEASRWVYIAANLSIVFLVLFAVLAL